MREWTRRRSTRRWTTAAWQSRTIADIPSLVRGTAGADPPQTGLARLVSWSTTQGEGVNLRKAIVLALAAGALALSVGGAAFAGGGAQIRINVALKTDATASVLAELGKHGKVRDVMRQIDAVAMQARESALPAIRALPYVAAANPDAERKGAPIDTVGATDFLSGINTWDLDADQRHRTSGPGARSASTARTYTSPCSTRACSTRGVSTSPSSASQRSSRRRSAAAAARTATSPSRPNKWEHDQNSHGTHVTSTVLGYSLTGTPVNGVAPQRQGHPRQGARARPDSAGRR